MRNMRDSLVAQTQEQQAKRVFPSGPSPKYASPPVVETVIGVQFPELARFRCVHFGLYQKHLKSRFPDFEDRPRIRPAAEPFPRRLIPPEPPFQILASGAPGRVWYIAQSKHELLQVQPDRFMFNWRAQGGSATYPSYDVNSRRFLDEFGGFRKFCADKGVDEPTPELCEVTYVNHILPHPDESAVDLFGRVFTGLRWETTDGLLSAPESASFNRVWVIPEQQGRLYAQANLAYEVPTKRELIRLEITARVNRAQSDQVESALELAHAWVVHGFASMTDLDIQRERWRRLS
jgi:uncharacterized protein (TIGR04255 family)